METRYKAKKALTPSEREMYSLLVKALPPPEYIVLPQVSMQAFLDPMPENRAARNRIAQKYVDFLICTMTFFGVTIVELDDPSHIGREDRDAERDEMVYSSGLVVVRFDHIPHELSPAELREAILNPKMERVAESRERRKQYWARRNAWKKRSAE